MQKIKQNGLFKGKIKLPKKFFPIFWRECEKCNKLTIWEWMWYKRCYIPWPDGGASIKVCVCHHCAKTQQQAKSILKDYN